MFTGTCFILLVLATSNSRVTAENSKEESYNGAESYYGYYSVEPSFEPSIEPSVEPSMEPFSDDRLDYYYGSAAPVEEPTTKHSVLVFNVLTKISGEQNVYLEDFTSEVVQAFTESMRAETEADAVYALLVYDLSSSGSGSGDGSRLQRSSVIGIETVTTFFPENPYTYSTDTFMSAINTEDFITSSLASMAFASLDKSFKKRIVNALMDSSISQQRVTMNPAKQLGPSSETYTVRAAFYNERGIVPSYLTTDVMNALTTGVMTYSGADEVNAVEVMRMSEVGEDNLRATPPTVVIMTVTFLDRMIPSASDLEEALGSLSAVSGILLLMAEAAFEDKVKRSFESSTIRFSVGTSSPTMSPTSPDLLLGSDGMDKSSRSSDAEIAGAIVGSIIGVCICGAVIYFGVKTINNRRRFHQGLRESIV